MSTNKWWKDQSTKLETLPDQCVRWPRTPGFSGQMGEVCKRGWRLTMTFPAEGHSIRQNRLSKDLCKVEGLRCGVLGRLRVQNHQRLRLVVPLRQWGTLMSLTLVKSLKWGLSFPIYAIQSLTLTKDLKLIGYWLAPAVFPLDCMILSWTESN
jgi:hypothetical protein